MPSEFYRKKQLVLRSCSWNTELASPLLIAMTPLGTGQPRCHPTRLSSPIFRFKGTDKEYKVKFMGYIYCGFISANITSHAVQCVSVLTQQNTSRGILLVRDKNRRKHCFQQTFTETDLEVPVMIPGKAASIFVSQRKDFCLKRFS